MLTMRNAVIAKELKDELQRVAAHRDQLLLFVEVLAGRPCSFGSGCANQQQPRVYCDPCAARATLETR